MSTIKKIAIIIQSLHGGGAERTAANLSLYFSKEYEVHLIIFDGRVISYPYAGTLHDLKVYPSKNIIKKIINVIRRVLKTSLIKLRYDVDVTISLMEESNVVNLLSISGDKKITSIRNYESKSSYNTIFEKIAMFLVKHCSDVVVALSKGVEDDLVHNCGIPKSKVVTIYNPCDGELLKEKASLDNAIVDMAENSVATMGRLTKQKGQWHLIRAFRRVVNEIPNAILYVFGQGELEEKLKKLTIELNLEHNVKFMGYVESPHSYISKSKVFVFPSLYEGLGNVLLEAMACGVPCISTDCYCGPREILAPGTKIKEKLDRIEKAQYGILVSADDTGNFECFSALTLSEIQLANSIINILKNEAAREHYAHRALERSNDFSPHEIIRQWKNIL